MRRSRGLGLLLSAAAVLVVGVAYVRGNGLSFAQGGGTFHGIVLPAPESVGVAGAQPPSAWLILGRRATATTFGSSCYGSACVDIVALDMMHHVSTVAVRTDQASTVVIDVPRLNSLRATISPWHAQSRTQPHQLAIHTHTDGGRLVIRLPALGQVRDAVLAVSVEFAPRTPTWWDPHVGGGDAVYLWRITPAQPAPPVLSFPAIYQRAAGRWEATKTLHQGERARFALRFRLNAPNWNYPRAHLVLRQAFMDHHGGTQYRQTVYAIGMRRARAAGGLTRFWVDVVIPHRLKGLYLAEFRVTNGVGLVGPTDLLTVKASV